MAQLRESGLSRYDMPEFFLCVDEFPLPAFCRRPARRTNSKPKTSTSEGVSSSCRQRRGQFPESLDTGEMPGCRRDRRTLSMTGVGDATLQSGEADYDVHITRRRDNHVRALL